MKKTKKLNMFIDIIYEKMECRSVFSKFFNYLKMKRFKRILLTSSPSFYTIWQISDFIKYAERLFFYSNNIKNALYSSTDYVDGENGFKIKDKNVIVTVKVYKVSAKVTLQIDYINSSTSLKKIPTSMEFVNNVWVEDHTKYDEILLENVIRIIYKYVFELFDELYHSM